MANFFFWKLAVVNLTNEWLYELLLQRLFYQYDVDGSGMLSSFELRRVLGAAGFKMDNSTMKSLVWRYTDEQFNLSLDSYFICLGKLMKLFSKFWALTFRLFLLFFKINLIMQDKQYARIFIYHFLAIYFNGKICKMTTSL